MPGYRERLRAAYLITLPTVEHPQWARSWRMWPGDRHPPLRPADEGSWIHSAEVSGRGIPDAGAVGGEAAQVSRTGR